MEDDAFVFGGKDFVAFGRHVLDGAAIDQMHRAGAHAPGRAHAIHRHVAAADHQHVAVDGKRFAILDMLVHLEQEVDAGSIAFELRIFVADAEQGALARAVAEEYRVVALGQQVINREALAQYPAVVEFAAQLAHDVLAFGLEHILGQPVTGNADRGHPAGGFLGIEHIDLDAIEQQLVGAGDAGRSGADDRDALVVLQWILRELQAVVGDRLIGGRSA